MKKTSFASSWWLPDNPIRKLAGALQSDPEESTQLVLYDHLEEVDFGQEEWGIRDLRAISVPVVHGVRHEDGEDVALLGVSGHTLDVPSQWVTNTFVADVALLGCHVEADGFTRIDIEYDYLIPWADPPSRVDNSDRRVAKIRTDRICIAERVLGDGASVSLYTGISGQWGSDGANITDHAAFAIEVPEPLPALELIERYVKPLQDLLMVSLGVVLRLTEVRLSAESKNDFPITGRALFPYDQWPAADHEPKRSQQWSQVIDYRAPTLLTASRLVDQESPLDVGDVILGWLDQYNSIREVSRQLLAPFYTSSMSPEHTYSSTFQSAEALHPLLGFDPRDLPKPDHTERYRRVVDFLKTSPKIPAEDAAWAAKVLPSRNDKSLAVKIEEVLTAAGTAGALLIDAAPHFGTEAGRMRGKVAHGGAQASAERRRARAIYELGLRWIVRGHLICRLLGQEEARLLWERMAERERFKSIVRALSQVSGHSKL